MRCANEGLWAAYMPPERKYEPVVQDPHRLARCRDEPDVLWCQHHNGVFRSLDGGKTWRELTVPTSSFGYAVAAHPQDPNTAWLVPAEKDERRVPVDGRLVVARTRDGGRHFELLSSGLPEAPAYDLVYRHALDVSDDGEALALGSTTGSLWISEDGGDHFEVVSEHLPPIYAVRFT